jgi:hypothetical protein
MLLCKKGESNNKMVKSYINQVREQKFWDFEVKKQEVKVIELRKNRKNQIFWISLFIYDKIYEHIPYEFNEK